MANIYPKTYNEVVRLARCMELSKYLKGMPDDLIEEMYNFMSEDDHNTIISTPEMITFLDHNGNTIKAMPWTYGISDNVTFDKIIINAGALTTLNLHILRNDSSSGCSSCSGCSTNNNNNNNNNG